MSDMNKMTYRDIKAELVKTYDQIDSVDAEEKRLHVGKLAVAFTSNYFDDHVTQLEARILALSSEITDILCDYANLMEQDENAFSAIYIQTEKACHNLCSYAAVLKKTRTVSPHKPFCRYGYLVNAWKFSFKPDSILKLRKFNERCETDAFEDVNIVINGGDLNDE